MPHTSRDLALALAASDQQDYVRLVAHWLTHGVVEGEPPPLVGDEVVDALVAAAVAHRARLIDQEPPSWTRDPDRLLDFFWHPGDDRFFALALAHAPAEFAVRRIFVDADSLLSV